MSRQQTSDEICGARDVRNRPLEFSDRSNRTKAEVIATLEKRVAEADAVLAKLTAEQLILPRRIQGFETKARYLDEGRSRAEGQNESFYSPLYVIDI